MPSLPGPLQNAALARSVLPNAFVHTLQVTWNMRAGDSIRTTVGALAPISPYPRECRRARPVEESYCMLVRLIRSKASTHARQALSENDAIIGYMCFRGEVPDKAR